MQKYLIVIAGPTASGKTSLGIELANHFGTSIISADSRQFYREMEIGTAKPTVSELAAAPHYLINNLSIHDEYSVGDFEREAIALLDELYLVHDVVLLVGGSGLFIKAVLEGLDEFPDVPIEIRNDYINLYEEKGIGALQSELREKDIEYYESVDISNHHRLIRALSVIRVSGQTFSSFRKKTKKPRSFEPIIIGLEWNREILYDRINRRVDMMVRDGLLDEVKALMPHQQLNALQTVGYQEIFDFLNGQHDWDTAIELIKRNSRRYAKRQMTWLRKVEGIQHFHPSQTQDIIAFISERMGISDNTNA